MNEVAVSLLAALMRTSVSLVVAAIVLQLVLRWTRPVLPRVHRIVWVLVLLQGWFWWQLPIRIPVEEPAAQESAAVVKDGVVEAVASESLAKPPMLEEPFEAAVAPPAASRPLRDHVPMALLGTWLAGMLVFAGVGLFGYVRFLGQLFGSGIAEPEWTRQWDDLCARQGVRNVVLRVSANAGPLLCLTPWGYRLVVPAPLWQRLASAERLSILRHELAHLERGDVLKSMLVRILVLPQWFNPLAWLAARRFDEAAEWACDEAAQGPRGQEVGQYAQALLQLDAVFGQYPSYRAAAWGRGLSVRISRLLNPRVEEDSLMKRMAIQGAALGLVAVCLVRVSLVAQEPPKKNGPPGETAAAVTDFRCMPQDAKLTEGQRAYRDWDANQFGIPDATKWEKLTSSARAEVEKKYLEQLTSEEEKERVEAIDALVSLGSKKAVPGILQIAAERTEKNNWDRHTATRALGMLGDLSVVPDLVHLTYHYNWNVRQWAQISLTRLTGQTYGRDLVGWANWWKGQGRTPAISEERIIWGTSPEVLPYTDPKKQEENDRQMERNLLQKRNGQDVRQSKGFQEQVKAARRRMRQDQSRFSQQDLAEMESLTRIADQNFGSQAAWDAMKKLVDKYPKSNRMGCSLVYLGQMNKDGQKPTYLKQAIDEYSDCYYGDGVQVGAFARLLLGQMYWDSGKRDEAKKLFDELRRDYPKAIGHNGQLLVEQLPQE